MPLARAAKVVTFGGFKRCTTPFRVAGVALRDMPTCFITCPKSFCVTGAILLRRFQKIRCIFRGKCSTLETSVFILRRSCITLDAWRFFLFLFFANRIVRVASSGDNVQIAWQPWGMRVSFGVASAAFGEDLSCVDCHFVKLVQYLGHSALYTLHSTLYTLHSTYTCHSHSTLYTLHF